ncbi:hypothetical protein QAD02_015471 [Eretmocerus hayati]|uniref:Uncharacterized protein n=1 Tax=Eretmocerus hayati TaxID=131215 RepID=A0ACC2PAT1_9HYME|nr:hypothetical protein QAD02_015471 [Eretmocerus hayati]
MCLVLLEYKDKNVSLYSIPKKAARGVEPDVRGGAVARRIPGMECGYPVKGPLPHSRGGMRMYQLQDALRLPRRIPVIECGCASCGALWEWNAPARPTSTGCQHPSMGQPYIRDAPCAPCQFYSDRVTINFEAPSIVES